MSYFTDVGPPSGPILLRDGHLTIDVFKDPHDAARVGTALPVGSTPGGVAIWEIAIRGVAVPGRWIVLGREFMPRT